MPTTEPQAIRDILVNAHTIALVGASDKPHRASHEVMAYLQQCGYRVIPVNPSLAGQTVLGERVYPDLSAVPETVDMADLFLASSRTGPVMDEAVALGIPVIWLQIGVFNEDGAARAEAAGHKVVMNRCPKQEIPRLGLSRML